MKDGKKPARKKKKAGISEIKRLLEDIGSDFDPETEVLVSEDGCYHGTVESVRFCNRENGYTVFTFDVSGNLLTAVGIMPGVGEGDRIAVIGKWETNPRFGKQLKVLEYRIEQPEDPEDIERYLASGAIKGIGPKTARRIVEAFGKDAAEVIANHPEWLASIPGITPVRAAQISKEFVGKADMRTVLTYFSGYTGPAVAVRLFNRFGSSAVEIASKNPYALADAVEGFGFSVADTIARKNGIAPDSPDRITSGVLYTLKAVTAREGHTCLPMGELVSRAASFLGVSVEPVPDAVRTLIETGTAVIEKRGDVAFVYERSVCDDESFIASRLRSLSTGSVQLDLEDIELFIRRSEAEKDIVYDDRQKSAIMSALRRGVLVLTGGPGTGKTTVIDALIGIFNALDMKIALAAPTGRAAKKMTEATGYEAKTVHRLLEVAFAADAADVRDEETKFNRNADNPLDEDVVILDEVSMMDTRLTAALLRAIPRGGRLILIGDSDQLPSVGQGNVLHDLIASGALPTVALEKVWRQAEQSLIVTNAHAINRGEMPVLDARDRDFFFLEKNDDAAISSLVCDLCARRLPSAYRDGPVQVIAPGKKGEVGTENLNRMLQRLINPPEQGKREIQYERATFRYGDRVMQVKNNYSISWESASTSGQGVFNGDIGEITSIDPPTGTIEVDFDGRKVVYSGSETADLELAYAVTVHKSQGSEYPTVVIPLGNVPPMLETRNLIYTAVTRAVRRVVIVGRRDVIGRMIANAGTCSRYTGLCEKLRASDRKSTGVKG